MAAVQHGALAPVIRCKHPTTPTAALAELRSKYPTLLKRTIKRIRSEELPPLASTPFWLFQVMRISQNQLLYRDVTRRKAEINVLRYLMCKEEMKVEVSHG